jgi:CrcB protein
MVAGDGGTKLTIRRHGRTEAAMFATLLHVALGGAIGASLRYLSGVAAMRLIGPGFPWATLFVNVAGSFAMGVLVVVLASHGNRLAPFLMTGVLGGFTTFSAFSLDAVSLWGRAPGLAAAYVAGSVALSLAALVAGMAVAR